mmetsp:Transcript_14903/g.34414  ORF Transcript_14903/g.34414 Transcript_14903/m.34414 type:complete len:206 (+) Transcript_14903:623-1240(+)
MLRGPRDAAIEQGRTLAHRVRAPLLRGNRHHARAHRAWVVRGVKGDAKPGCEVETSISREDPAWVPSLCRDLHLVHLNQDVVAGPPARPTDDTVEQLRNVVTLLVLLGPLPLAAHHPLDSGARLGAAAEAKLPVGIDWRSVIAVLYAQVKLAALVAACTLRSHMQPGFCHCGVCRNIEGEPHVGLFLRPPPGRVPVADLMKPERL